MGDSISDGTLIEYTISENTHVQADQIIARIETDKVTVDVRAPSDGFVKSLRAKAGDTVAVGADLIELASDNETGSPPHAQQYTNEKQTQKAVPTSSQSSEPSTGPSSKPSPLASYESPSSGTPSTSVDMHQQRSHRPMIHFRYGLRDAEGHFETYMNQTENVQDHAPGKSDTTVAKQSGPKTGVNAPRHPSEFFTPSAQEFRETNQRAAEAIRKLPEFYRKPKLKKTDWELIDFGGAENYLTKKEKAALEKGTGKGKKA